MLAIAVYLVREEHDLLSREIDPGFHKKLYSSVRKKEEMNLYCIIPELISSSFKFYTSIADFI